MVNGGCTEAHSFLREAESRLEGARKGRGEVKRGEEGVEER